MVVGAVPRSDNSKRCAVMVFWSGVTTNNKKKEDRLQDIAAQNIKIE